MSKPRATIDVQYAVTADGMPLADDISHWVHQALPADRQQAELTVRLVDEAEITALNREYRGKEGATNVLSFPYVDMPGVSTSLLGDVVICAPVVTSEAITQNKSLDAHWAHMVLHGVLHLLGYDHQQDADARQMEDREAELLAGLGFSTPWQD